MSISIINIQPKTIGLYVFLLFFLVSCVEEKNDNNEKDTYKAYENIKYLTPIDSVEFKYDSDTWKGKSPTYSEDRFGYKIFLSKNDEFKYVSINSNNQLHQFSFENNVHQYSKEICNSNIDAYKIDSNLLYLLYDGIFYTKNYELETIDSFYYRSPAIYRPHGIDFTVENGENLYKVNDYFVLMYYINDEKDEYRSTKYLFYYFNQDTSFFASKMCDELDSSFQYFRCPVIKSDGKYLFHSPRIMNCISKSSDLINHEHKSIDKNRNEYHILKNEDQYQISKLKKYRFNSDYNKDLIIDDNRIYLLKEFLQERHKSDNIDVYNHDLELIIFDNKLNRVDSHFIEDNSFSVTFADKGRLFLFNIIKNKYYIYEI